MSHNPSFEATRDWIVQMGLATKKQVWKAYIALGGLSDWQNRLGGPHYQVPEENLLLLLLGRIFGLDIWVNPEILKIAVPGPPAPPPEPPPFWFTHSKPKEAAP